MVILESMSEGKSLIAMCCASLVAVIMIVTSIALTVFSGIALSDNPRHELIERCPESDIWTYLIVMTIMTGLGILSLINSLRDKDNQNSSERDSSLLKFGVYMVAILITCIGFAVWGGLVLYSDCSVTHLQETKVWYMAYIHYVLRIVVGSVVLAGLLSYPVVMCFVIRTASTATSVYSSPIGSPVMSPTRV